MLEEAPMAHPQRVPAPTSAHEGEVGVVHRDPRSLLVDFAATGDLADPAEPGIGPDLLAKDRHISKREPANPHARRGGGWALGGLGFAVIMGWHPRGGHRRRGRPGGGW